MCTVTLHAPANKMNSECFQPLWTLSVQKALLSHCPPSVTSYALQMFLAAVSPKFWLLSHFFLVNFVRLHTLLLRYISPRVTVVHSLVTSQLHPTGTGTPHTQFSSTQLPVICSFHTYATHGECSRRFECELRLSHRANHLLNIQESSQALLVPQRREFYMFW
jgi:hypothetical protein